MIRQIVLVDDEPSVLSALKLLLQALGYEVNDFNAPLIALEFLRTAQNCDLCLCDLKMPKMNGIQVLQEVRKIHPNLPFVLMSAHAGSEEIQAANKLGSSGFLSKPFTPQELTQLIDNISNL